MPKATFYIGDQDSINEELYYAAYTGNEEDVVDKINRGAQVNAEIYDEYAGNSYTPLIAATLQGHIKSVQKLLYFHANVNKKAGKSTKTALLHAANAKNVELVQLLLSHGADANKADASGCTPLISAIIPTTIEQPMPDVKQLSNDTVDKNKDSNFYRTLEPQINQDHPSAHLKKRQTELYLDAKTVNKKRTNNQIQTIKILLKHNADIQKADFSGNTPLIHAVQSASIDIIKLLLHEGAIVSCINREGKTPLAIAEKTGQNDAIEVLMHYRDKQYPKRGNSQPQHLLNQVDSSATVDQMPCLCS